MSNMLIYIDEPEYKLVAAQEGCGDNLTKEDEAEGYKDYWLASIYSWDGEQIELLDSAQILTKTLIPDMDNYEKAESIVKFFTDEKDVKYVILYQ